MAGEHKGTVLPGDTEREREQGGVGIKFEGGVARARAELQDLLVNSLDARRLRRRLIFCAPLINEDRHVPV